MSSKAATPSGQEANVRLSAFVGIKLLSSSNSKAQREATTVLGLAVGRWLFVCMTSTALLTSCTWFNYPDEFRQTVWFKVSFVEGAGTGQGIVRI